MPLRELINSRICDIRRCIEIETRSCILANRTIGGSSFAEIGDSRDPEQREEKREEIARIYVCKWARSAMMIEKIIAAHLFFYVSVKTFLENRGKERRVYVQ